MRTLFLPLIALQFFLQACTFSESNCQKHGKERDYAVFLNAYYDALEKDKFHDMKKIAKELNEKDECSHVGWFLMGSVAGYEPAFEGRDYTQKDMELELGFMERAAELAEDPAYIWAGLADDLRGYGRHELAVDYYRLAMKGRMLPNDMTKIAVNRAKSSIALADYADAEVALFFAFSYESYYIDPDLFGSLVKVLLRTHNRQIIIDTWRGVAPTLGLMPRQRALEFCTLVTQNIGGKEGEECVYQIDRKPDEPVERPII